MSQLVKVVTHSVANTATEVPLEPVTSSPADQIPGVAPSLAAPTVEALTTQAPPEAASLSVSDPDAVQPTPPEPRPSTENPLYQVRTTLRACVGSATITLGELLAVEQDQVLVLDRTLQDPVDLELNGQVVARGHLTVDDAHFAVCLSEITTALDSPFKP